MNESNITFKPNTSKPASNSPEQKFSRSSTNSPLSHKVVNRLLDYGEAYSKKRELKQDLIPKDQSFKPTTYKAKKKTDYLTLMS